jgi:hypothetical protein
VAILGGVTVIDRYEHLCSPECETYKADDGEWVKYEDIAKYIEYAESVTISDMEGKAAKIRNALDSLMHDAKTLYLLKSKLIK